MGASPPRHSQNVCLPGTVGLNDDAMAGKQVELLLEGSWGLCQKSARTVVLRSSRREAYMQAKAEWTRVE